ncbi:hypothetical protein BV372_05680 [Nostoc sp. T09]|uniref:hypothetical protein n=1 Tax=Nostoc sp. T09 TaxID=1932621 RepID=UPI000A3C0598|nr:hypothetical protein [Nostoc sp. T09]OUL36773.1 hypothetical protein BV372_05680 [Nostoc sp. T09]
MPILLNDFNGDSLLTVIENQVRLASSNNNFDWIFYAMTCYFKQEATEKLAKKINDILGNKLFGFHILIDKDEWFKESLNDKLYLENLSNITKLSIDDISLIPISAKNNKLFHSKSYALIHSSDKNIDNYKGFAFVTSGNLTNAGLEKNIEIGHIVYDNDSLRNFTDIFFYLKENYTLSEEDLAEQKEFMLAFNLLSNGSFYHQWQQQHQIDLKFRLKLSAEEKKRRRNKTNRPEIDLGYDIDQETESFSRDPINIELFFNKFPKPIPDKFLGTYSIDTLLGKWVPNKISELIEAELNNTTNIYIQIFKENITQNMDTYLKELKSDIDYLKARDIIDWNDEHNRNAIPKWEKRVTQIYQDQNLIKLLLWKYEKIPVVINSIEERTLILTLYQRLKNLYNPSIKRNGVGKILSENEHDNLNKYFNEFFKEIVNKAEEELKNNKLSDLYKPDNKRKNFCAIVNPGNQIVTGVFIRLIFYPDRGFTYKTSENSEEKFCPIENLVTFKIINS